MNERIKKLLQQAMSQSFDRDNRDGDIDKMYIPNIFVEEFVDVIVKECASINYKSPFLDGEFHAREILEHFGVE